MANRETKPHNGMKFMVYTRVEQDRNCYDYHKYALCLYQTKTERCTFDQRLTSQGINAIVHLQHDLVQFNKITQYYALDQQDDDQSESEDVDISSQEHDIERLLLRWAVKHGVSLSAIDCQEFRNLKDAIIQRSQKNSTDSKDCVFKIRSRKHYSKSAKQFGMEICNFILNYLRKSFATIAMDNSTKGHNQLTAITINNPSIPEFNSQFLDLAVNIS
ncbi:MAG: hypothetical protein EZS28_044607, partial [Streblomastix strix]